MIFLLRLLMFVDIQSQRTSYKLKLKKKTKKKYVDRKCVYTEKDMYTYTPNQK